MNILFSAGILESRPFANNNIEMLLADTLSDMGHKCFVIGTSFDGLADSISEKGCYIKTCKAAKIYKDAADCLEKYLAENKEKKPIPFLIKKFILLHPIYSIAIFLLERDIPYKSLAKKYVPFTKQIIKDNDIDFLICFTYPFEKVKLLFDSDIKIKKLYYQFDPFGLHETLFLDNKEKNMLDEAAVISKACSFLTTRALYSQYENHPIYKKYIGKTTAVDFPILSKKHSSGCEIPFIFNKDNTNILFCGTIDDGFRNPEYILTCLEELFSTHSFIKIYFLGPQQGVCVENWSKKFPENIFFHPAVESKIATEATIKADILLNISNSISNMVPSKIFDYFSTGKPIINVQKIENSPEDIYFKSYPLTFTLKEFLSEKNPTELLSFINTTQNNPLSFEAVAEIFHTATPQYVSNIIIDIANRSIDG